AAFPTIDSLKLGEDYKDIKADIKFLTHRTDIVDTKLAGYVTEFQKMYPNVKITYEAVTDYREDVIIRLTTGDWGDICMIPTTVLKAEAPTLFETYGDYDKIGETYDFIDNYAYEGQVYGIASTVNAQGVLYNKKVFADAGITTLPKTPDEYLAALKAIKDKTDAIPLYTNFAAGWTMGAWDAYIGGSATGDPDFMNNVLPHAKDPFAKKGDATGPYAVYNVLYEAVARGLVEDDPTTSDWESSKGMLNRGEIGTMVLGSWAYSQMRDAGETPDDVGYMSFPITVNGKQYASAGPDYMYGININSSDDNKIASMLYVKYLTEQSNFAFSEGGIPIVKGAEKPEVYSAFEGVEFVVDNPSVAGEETFLNDVNTKSEVGINMENTHVQRVLESAFDKSETMDDIAADWNAKWAAAQADLGITVNK
ncbi:MAG: sugar transporter substrate-binding protein, partial [Lachnospiraceae bacterium]|nr:sugar transporter substrate-binding protein [Lachnospiraceae bacterium]